MAFPVRALDSFNFCWANAKTVSDMMGGVKPSTSIHSLAPGPTWGIAKRTVFGVFIHPRSQVNWVSQFAVHGELTILHLADQFGVTPVDESSEVRDCGKRTLLGVKLLQDLVDLLSFGLSKTGTNAAGIDQPLPFVIQPQEEAAEHLFSGASEGITTHDEFALTDSFYLLPGWTPFPRKVRAGLVLGHDAFQAQFAGG